MSKILYAPEGGEGQGGGTLLAGATTAAATTTAGNGTTATTQQTTAPVVNKSFREGWIGHDGKIDKTAYDRLPEHLKPFKDQFAKYDTDEALLQAFAHQSSLIGKKGLLPLPAGASDKDKAEFNARIREIMRVPEKPEGYGIKRPDDVPEDLWNDDYAKGVTEIAHKHNVSPDAMAELFKFDMEFGAKNRTESDAQLNKQIETERATLQTKWGGDFGKNVELAKRAARTAGLDPAKDPIFRNARVVEAFAAFAAMVSDDKLVSGDTGNNGGGSDEAKALDVINNKANPLNAAYWDQNNPQHTHAVNMVQEYNKRAIALKAVKK